MRLANAPSPSNDELQNNTFDNFVLHAKWKAIGNDANMFFNCGESRIQMTPPANVMWLWSAQKPSRGWFDLLTSQWVRWP